MAAGTLPAPGTTVGPCPYPCDHRDCKATRKTRPARPARTQ